MSQPSVWTDDVTGDIYIKMTPIGNSVIRNGASLFDAMVRFHGIPGIATDIIKQMNASSDDINNTLHHAAERFYPEWILALIQAGADVKYANLYDVTALYWIVGSHNKEKIAMIKVFVDAGADLNAECCNGLTPLYSAARLGFHETIYTLTTLGDDPNRHYKGTSTPLHSAARNGHVLAVSALLTAGADRTIRTCYGYTAADLAQSTRLADRDTRETVFRLLNNPVKIV